MRAWMNVTLPIEIVAGVLLSIGLATNIYVLVKVSLSVWSQRLCTRTAYLVQWCVSLRVCTCMCLGHSNSTAVLE